MKTYAFIGLAESDRLEEENRLYYLAAPADLDPDVLRARLADAEAHRWLTPDEVRERLGRPTKGTASEPAAPAEPRHDLHAGDGRERAGSETDGAGCPPRPGGELAGIGEPHPVRLSAISRLMRLRWPGRAR